MYLDFSSLWKYFFKREHTKVLGRYSTRIWINNLNLIQAKRIACKNGLFYDSDNDTESDASVVDLFFCPSKTNLFYYSGNDTVSEYSTESDVSCFLPDSDTDSDSVKN